MNGLLKVYFINAFCIKIMYSDFFFVLFNLKKSKIKMLIDLI